MDSPIKTLVDENTYPHTHTHTHIQCRYLEGAFFFAVLLNFKHIFLYIVPAYFFYLLRQYCFQSSNSNQSPSSPAAQETQKERKQTIPLQYSSLLKDFSPINFLKLGTLVVAVFLVSFGPFLYLVMFIHGSICVSVCMSFNPLSFIQGQLKQVLSQLFPFRRGLCHAYWAPNVWALYSVADKLLAVIGQSNHTTIVFIKSASSHAFLLHTLTRYEAGIDVSILSAWIEHDIWTRW